MVTRPNKSDDKGEWKRKTRELASALICDTFVFNSSPQGEAYWKQVYTNLIDISNEQEVYPPRPTAEETLRKIKELVSNI